MGYLRCQNCGRTIYSAYYKEVGLPCGSRGCSGVMAFIGGYIVPTEREARLDLKCDQCSHICSSKITKLNFYDPCPVKGCDGRLQSYYGY